MKNKKLIILLSILIVIIGVYFFNDFLNNKNIVKDKNNLNKASLRLGWIPSASFAGEYIGAKRFDEKYNLDLECVAGGPGLNSIQMVLANENEFGTIAADEVIAANEKGADLVIIGVINYFSPGAFVSLKEKQILTPKDFENKKVGMLPFGSTTILYESLIEANNVNRKKITEITISPDLKSFINGIYDVQPIFVYDESVTLDLKNIAYNIIEPKDFGVKVKGPVYFCKRKLLKENPELVKSFIYTVADGWNYAIKNQKEAITVLKENAKEVNTERETLVLKKLVPYFSAYQNQPINSDIDSWNETINTLLKTKKINKKVDLNELLDLKFIKSYYKK